MSPDPDTWTIEITDSSVARETYADEMLAFGDTGKVRASVAEVMCGRGDGVRLDGCQAETDAGTPCTRDAGEGDFCHQHAPDEEGD